MDSIWKSTWKFIWHSWHSQEVDSQMEAQALFVGSMHLYQHVLWSHPGCCYLWMYIERAFIKSQFLTPPLTKQNKVVSLTPSLIKNLQRNRFIFSIQLSIFHPKFNNGVRCDPTLGVAWFLSHSWHSRAPLSGSHDFTIYIQGACGTRCSHGILLKRWITLR